MGSLTKSSVSVGPGAGCRPNLLTASGGVGAADDGRRLMAGGRGVRGEG